MKPEMRQTLARESFEQKIRKVGQLIRLAKAFPRRASSSAGLSTKRRQIHTSH